MNLSFRRKITSFLRFEELEGREELLRSIPAGEWSREFGWLDRSGLALPLTFEIQRRSLGHGIPGAILDSLEQRLQDNQKRMSEMLSAFAQITGCFEKQGIVYACAKGFSLIPDYQASLACRHQTDFDFLVTGQDMEAAEQILLDLGYRLIHKDQSGERRFATPGTKVKDKNFYLYHLQDSHAAELHLHFWEVEAGGMEFSVPIDAQPQHFEMHTVEGVTFPRLRPVYQLTYQLLHFFRHLSGTWARLLWLYEIGRFVSLHVPEAGFWQEANALWRQDEKLNQVCHFVLRLAAKTFAAPIPEIIDTEAEEWEACRLWCSHFSDGGLYVDLPGNKVALLFARPFFESEAKYRRYRAGRLLPIGEGKGRVLDERLSASAARSLRYRLRNFCYQGSRVIYHVCENFHFFFLKVQWERLRALQKLRHKATKVGWLKEAWRREIQ